MKQWIEKSRTLLRDACTPLGIRASLLDLDNYQSIFTRDAVMAGIAGLLLQDEVVINGFIHTLENLKKIQGQQGQIASNFKIEQGQIGHISYGTLSPKLDSCTWYLVGVGLLAKEGFIDKEAYSDSVRKAVHLLEGIEYNGKGLMYVPKGGNWADEYVYEGYILYDQLLRAWALGLLSEVYDHKDWKAKAKQISDKIQSEYGGEGSSHFHAATYPGGVFERFDLAAHALAGVVLKEGAAYEQSLDWIARTFLNGGELPPAFYPVITEEDEEWAALSRYHLYRFKNKPHHFHNGGIWWIWLGWLGVALSLWNRDDELQALTGQAFGFLDKVSDRFDFHEYLSGDKKELCGTPSLCFSATGIIFLSLAREGFDFSVLRPSSTMISEPFQIRKEYFQLSEQLVDHLKQRGLLKGQKIVVGVGGESGSGKSVTAKCLKIELERLGIATEIIHQDGYYKLTPKQNQAKRKEDISWVGKDELHLDQMQAHVQAFRAGEETITVPVVNYRMNSILPVENEIADVQVLIVEGVYALFLDGLDHKIFMSRNYKDTLEKRKSRIRETYDPFVEKVLAIEHELVKDHKKLADSVISKSYTLEARYST